MSGASAEGGESSVMPRSDPSPDGLSGLDFGARAPQRLTRADVDAAVLRSAGLGDLVDRLWREGAAASNAARRSVTAHLRERFGARDPHSGAILRVVFVLLLLSVLPIGMLNGIRLGIENTVVPGAIVSVVVGAGVVAAVAAAGGDRSDDRSPCRARCSPSCWSSPRAWPGWSPTAGCGSPISSAPRSRRGDAGRRTGHSPGRVHHSGADDAVASGEPARMMP